MTFPAHWLSHPYVGLYVATRGNGRTRLDDWLYSIRWQGCAVTGRTYTEATCHHPWEVRWDLLPAKEQTGQLSLIELKAS